MITATAIKTSNTPPAAPTIMSNLRRACSRRSCCLDRGESAASAPLAAAGMTGVGAFKGRTVAGCTGRTVTGTPATGIPATGLPATGRLAGRDAGGGGSGGAVGVGGATGSGGESAGSGGRAAARGHKSGICPASVQVATSWRRMRLVSFSSPLAAIRRNCCSVSGPTCWSPTRQNQLNSLIASRTRRPLPAPRRSPNFHSLVLCHCQDLAHRTREFQFLCATRVATDGKSVAPQFQVLTKH